MKIKALYLYLAALAWAIVLGLVLRFTNFNATGAGVTLAVLTLIFLPGAWLYRLIGFQAKSLAQKILYIIGLGFCYFFLLNFLGILLNLSLGQLSFAIMFVSFVLFGCSLWEDRENFWQPDFSWLKKLNVTDWLLAILALGGAVAGFLAIDSQANKLIGDGYFHLAILNKVVSAEGLSSANLWITKNASMNLVYAFPIWHIFLGFVSRILNLNIFTTYIQILLPLVIMLFLVVWGLARAVFKNRYLTIVAFLSFLSIMLSGLFYNLVTLRSPDSLVRLLIFPLVLALTCNYLFCEERRKLADILLIVVLVILMGLVHFTQLLDFCWVLVVFVILGLIFMRQNSREILVKVGWIFLILFVFIFGYAVLFHFAAFQQFISGNMAATSIDSFPNKSYLVMGNIYLYIAFSLPLLAIFLKKENRLVFLSALALALMLISWQFFQLRPLFLKFLGPIFTARAITDIPGFLFLGFIIFVLAWGINFLLARKKIILYMANFLIPILLIVIIALTSFRGPLANFIDNGFFSSNIKFFYNFFVPLLILFIAGALVAFIYARFILRRDPEISDPKDKTNFFILIFFIFAILASPYLGGLGVKIVNNPNGSLFANRENLYTGDEQNIGGEKTLDFLRTLPSSSVVVTSNVSFAQILLLQKNVYLAEYPYAIKKFTYSQDLFNPNLPAGDRITILDQNQINYVFCLNSSENAIFAADSAHFQKVFENSFRNQKNIDLVVYRYSE